MIQNSQHVGQILLFLLNYLFALLSSYPQENFQTLSTAPHQIDYVPFCYYWEIQNQNYPY